MRAVLLNVSCLLVGSALGAWFAGIPQTAPQYVVASSVTTPVSPGAEAPSVAVARLAAAVSPTERKVANSREEELLRRIADLEARLAAAQTAAEPRLASNRLRARQRLQAAIAEQPLRHASFYFDLCDFVAVPSLLAERPLEFAECLERFVLATGTHRGRVVDPEWGKRETVLEAQQDARLSISRYQKSRGHRNNGIRVRLTLPGSLPLGHVDHLEYSFYAAFGADGTIAQASISRQNGPKGTIGMSLSRREDGSIALSVPRESRSLERSPQDRAALHAALTACALRLASLGT